MTRSRKTHRASFGSVRKLPSGRYQARYTDQRMVSHTAPHTFETKRGAEDWLAGIRADMVRGTWRDPALGRITLAEYAGQHLATRLDLSPVTARRYADLLRTWIDQPLTLPSAGAGRARTVHLGAAELGSLSLALIRDWHTAALHTSRARAAARAAAAQQRSRRDDRHAARRWAIATGLPVKHTGRLSPTVLEAWRAAGAPLSPLTAPGPPGVSAPDDPSPAAAATAGRPVVAQAYRLVRMILNHAVDEGRLDANPCRIHGAGHVKSVERVPATPAQITALAAAMPERYQAALTLAAWSGLRAGELFALARRHVDLDAGTLRVERAAIYLPGTAPYFGPPKTDSSRRTVHLPPHVLPALRDHLARYAQQGPDGLVFADERGSIVPRETRLKAFARARAAVGLTELRWHDLRHTGATLAAQSGASLRELQHRFGHSTARAAMIYQHAEAARDRALAERMSHLAGLTDNHRASIVPLFGKEA